MGSIENRVRISPDNPSIQRIEEKCIKCGVCLKTCENKVGLDRSREREDIPLCINCGQCILSCPMGALTTKFDYKKVLNLVKDSNKLIAISVAPAVRVALGEELGFALGFNIEGILPSILRAIGFDYVFDVTFGADVTIMEEASEFVERLHGQGKKPMFTSCCPGWVKYASIFHRELLLNLSTTKSPIGIQSTLIKTYFKKLNSIEEDIISVVVAPCTAKKSEIQNGDTDYIITTHELALMIKECGIDILALKPSEFDKMLSKGSRSGVIFGRSGGVSEALLSTVHYMLTGNTPCKDSYKIEIEDGVGSKTFKINGFEIKTLVISGLNNFEKNIEELGKYDLIEVMTCQGGCVNGGGQPLGTIKDSQLTVSTRTESLNDENTFYKIPPQNPEIIELYRSYLEKPNSLESEKLLHTIHSDLSNLVKNICEKR